MMTPAATAIKERFPGMENLEAQFTEVVLFWEGRDKKNVRYCPEDVAIIQWKRQQARADKDYKTSDYLRDWLTSAGVKVRDK